MMMFTVKLRNTAEHIEVVSCVTNKTLFFAMVEANAKDPEVYESGYLKEVVYGAAKYVDLFADDCSSLPAEFGQAINSVLRSSSKGDRVGLVYAGITVTPERSYLCTAGDIRVHLIAGEEIVQRTMDHTYLEEARSKGITDMPSLPEAILQAVLTRCIGPLCSVPPEEITWQYEVGMRIVVCSSAYHRYRNPSEYIQPVKEGGEMNRQEILWPGWAIADICSYSH